ncbi:MAG TPA: hypothetical protein VHH35_20445 [Pyrinomonadaceae bacterium]|nr:hypothetical protein [Pyrinomonadaceae bacterium]
MIASRVAARLKKEDGVEVETVPGSLGELSVSIDGRKVVDTNRFLYPLPGTVLKKVRAALAEER